jgi:hypothetical protein
MSLDQTVSELRQEIAELRRALFIGASALLAGLMLWNLSLFLVPSLSSIPRLGMLFEDMFGSRDKLPELTKFVFVYSRIADGVLPPAIIVSFTAVAWSLMSLNRRNGRFLWIAMIAAFLLILHHAIIKLAVESPLIQLMVGLRERS